MPDGAPIPNAECVSSSEGCQPFKFAVLCDNGAGDQIFLRCYAVDCPTGDITGFVDLEMDGVTPYVIVGDPVVCNDVTIPAPNIADAELLCFDAPPSPLMQVTVYDPTGGVVAGPFFLDPLTGLPAVPGGAVIACPDNQGFSKILCDGGNGNFEFVRFYTLDSSGVVTITDVDLDGAPYVVVGPVNDCCDELECIDGQYFVLCDDGTDPNTQFLRRYDVTTLGAVTTVDTELDGTSAYVVIGSVVICPTQTEITNWRDDVELEILCDPIPANGSPGQLVPFLRRYEYLEDGTLDTTVDTELDGITAYVPGSPPVPCYNQLIDVEPIVFCDEGNGGEQFLRRYTWLQTEFSSQPDNGQLGIVDTELDGVTAYVPTGPVALCPISAVIDTALGDEITAGRIRLNGAGADWDFTDTSGGRVKSITVICLNDGVAGGPGAGSDVTVTDSLGNSFDINTGEVFEWSADALDDELIDGGTFSVVLGAGAANAYVDVLWTEVV